MVYDTGYSKHPFPHKCGKVLEFCILDDGYTLYFCALCRLVVGYEKDGIKFMKSEIMSGHSKNEYSDDTRRKSI